MRLCLLSALNVEPIKDPGYSISDIVVLIISGDRWGAGAAADVLRNLNRKP